jgi:hypothetical protein
MNGTISPVLASIEAILADIGRVSFHPERVTTAVTAWGHILDRLPGWQQPCHFFDGGPQTVRWVFVLDVLNHCFWPDPGAPVWTVHYQGSAHSGYWGLAASLKRAVEDGLPLTDAATLAAMNAADLAAIFSGEGEIPLFRERLRNLREAGSVLLRSWQGDIVRLVAAAGGSALEVARLVTASFPSFRDQARYQGKTVLFWKRAQIFAADLHAAFAGSSWGAFHDIDRLTAFADYKLPQVLRELGVISYDVELARAVDGRIELAPGSEAEVAIRAMTVHAVEALREAFSRSGRRVTAAEVDHWLWQLGQLEPFRARPYHRCRTIYY